MKTDEAMALVGKLLDGMDATEVDHPDGWWETSVGASFGAERKAALLAIVTALVQERDTLRGAIDWVINDAKYKAPEQFSDPEISLRWISRLDAAMQGGSDG